MSQLASDADEVSSPPVGRSWPGVGDFVAALRELTVLGRGQMPPRIGVSALFYPLIGLGLGGLWVLTDHVASPRVGLPLASLAVLAATLLATGGRALLGAGRTLAAISIRSRDRSLAVMHGAPSAIVPAAAVAIFGLQLLCLLELDRLRVIGLAAAPLLGRWSMVVLAVGSLAARPDGRRIKFAPAVTFPAFGITSTLTFGLLFAATGFLGVILALSAALAIVALRILLHRRLDGVTDESLGAACELAQLVTLGLLAPF